MKRVGQLDGIQTLLDMLDWLALIGRPNAFSFDC